MVWMVVRMREGWIVLISMIPNWLGPSLPIWDSIQWLMLEIVIQKMATEKPKRMQETQRKSKLLIRWRRARRQEHGKCEWVSDEKVIFVINDPITYWNNIHSFGGVWRIVYKLVTVLFHTVYAPDGETRKNESESPLNERDIFNSITRKGKKETTNEIHTFKKKWKEWRRK